MPLKGDLKSWATILKNVSFVLFTLSNCSLFSLSLMQIKNKTAVIPLTLSAFAREQ